MQKNNPKIYMKSEKPLIDKKILRKKNKPGKIVLTDF